MNMSFFNKSFINVFAAINKKILLAWFLLVSFFILGLMLRLECLEVVRINFWLTRDIDRAFNLFDGSYIPLAGPETTNGLRLPGPALYFLMAIPLWFKYSYDSIFVFYLILNFSSLILTFWIIRKYFDFNTAFLASIYQLFHPLSIEGIAFPINPAFLLPIIPLLFWFVFEFALNKNEKYFPLIILIVAVGIQIHLSIAVFLIVPILWALIFKIKISLKTIINTFIVAVLSFVPFFFYEAQTYKPTISYVSVTKPDLFSSFIEPIKIMGVQNTVWRLSDIGKTMGNMSNFLGVPQIYPLLTFVLINCSLFGSVIFLFFSFKKNKTEDFKKSLLVVLFFYLPALIYDVIRPWQLHFWYNYIFILPTALLLSNFFAIGNSLLKRKRFQISLQVFVSVVVLHLALFNTNYFYGVKRDIQNHVSVGDYKGFQPLNLLIKNLSKHFDIPLHSYSDQVYFEEISPFSKKFIQLIGNDVNESNLKEKDNKDKSCYYFFSMKNFMDIKTGKFSGINKKMSSFLNDRTISILASNTFVYNGKKFGVKKYYPKFNQPCYQNSDNVFSTTLKDKILLNDYFQFQNNGNRFLKKKAEFDKDNNLQKLVIKAIYSDPTLDLPIRFQIILEKKPQNYSMSVKLDAYGWGKRLADKFTFKSMNIEIKDNANLINGQNKIKFPIINSGSWISEGFGFNFEKFSWYRIFPLPADYKLKKNSFLFNISGDIKEKNKIESCCKQFNFSIPVDLSINHS